MAEKDTSFGDALIGALEEALAYERGELPAARVHRVEITARGTLVEPAPDYSPEQIRAIRHDLSLSQKVFADLLNASASAVRAWEQGTRRPDGPTRRLLQVAEESPEVLQALLDPGGPRPYARPQPRLLMVAEERAPYGSPFRNPSRT